MSDSDVNRDEPRSAAERADALVRTLTQFGAPAAGFAVGVVEEQPDQIRTALVVHPTPAERG
jgi:hypothetical protein